MEVFNKAKAVKLHSHLDKYLFADDDHEKVRQSRNSSSRRAVWFVEFVEGKSNAIRLRSCHGWYLTATDEAFLLGWTGYKVIQSVPDKDYYWKYEWEPIGDGFQVKLRTWCGKYLRANGGTPPWRNSITHDDPYTSATKNWILWDVVAADALESESPVDFISTRSNMSALSDESVDWEPASCVSVVSATLPRSLSSKRVSAFFVI